MRWSGLLRRVGSGEAPLTATHLIPRVVSLTRMCLQPQLGEGKKENQKEGTNCFRQVPLNNLLLFPLMVPRGTVP